MNKSSYRLVITDVDRFPLSEMHMVKLEAEGIQLIGMHSGLSEDQVGELCLDADGVLVFGTKMTNSVIGRMQHCQILARCGIGYDNIDLQAAAAKGITVTYVPDYCVDEVAEHTIGLMVDCARRLTLSGSRVRQGHWDPYGQLGTIRRIAGRKVGLFGFGKIGQAVARKLMGFNVTMSAYDPSFIAPTVMKEMGVRSAGFDELARTSEIILVLMPLTPLTKHIFNQEAFANVTPGALFINTSRGGLVDEAALIEAIKDGRIASAGLDVIETEPPAADHPLLQFPQVIVTPHSAAFSEEALHDLKTRAIEEVIRKFRGLAPLMPVPDLSC